MASTELSAHLRYLNDSAHLLATTAPATSKYLMSRHNSIVFDNDLEQPEPQRGKFCSACGTIMAIGWEVTVQVQSQRSRQGKRSKEKVVPSKAMVYKCDSCSRTTRFVIPPAAIKHKALSLNSGSAVGPTKSTPLHQKPDTAAITTSANSSSKKRAKARKKGGLAAILANKKESEAQTSSFALMDFIKPV